MTKMFYNERTNGDIKDVEVEKLRKTKHEKISKLWCCYNIDCNKLLVFELIPNRRFNIMLYWLTTKYIIAMDVAKGVAYWHHNGAEFEISNKVLDAEFETKVEGFEVVKIVTFVSKGVESMNLTLGFYGYECCGYVLQRRVEEEKQWDPGGHVNLCTEVISSPFKLCDQGKLVLAVKFYNLEDKDMRTCFPTFPLH
jgi:hypothetical protein